MGWVVNATPPAALPPGKTRYTLYRRLGGPQARSTRMRKISPPPGFDPWAAQLVASRYTDLAIAAHHVTVNSVFRQSPQNALPILMAYL